MKDVIDSLDLIYSPFVETKNGFMRTFAPGKKGGDEYSLQPPTFLHPSFGLVFAKVVKDGTNPDGSTIFQIEWLMGM